MALVAWLACTSSAENKRDLADVPDEVLNKLQPIFYTDPINAAIRAMGLQ
ncbi:MAG: hypothetical protein ACYC1C_05975 [Chloroflexota bacterium]